MSILNDNFKWEMCEFSIKKRNITTTTTSCLFYKSSGRIRYSHALDSDLDVG